MGDTLGFHRDPDDLTSEERGMFIKAWGFEPEPAGWNGPGLLIRLLDLRIRWLLAVDRGDHEGADQLLDWFLGWSGTKRWAWDGLRALFLELHGREEPIPDSLQRWVNDSFSGRIQPPRKPRNPNFANQDERDLRISQLFRWITQGTIGRRQALYEIGMALEMSPHTVENAVDKKWTPPDRTD